METSWLIERLDNPALLQKGDEQRLRELIASYPYFSAPYLLLARSLHEQKHPAFEQLLPLISLQAFDRKRLFRLIHEETIDHRPWTMAEENRGDKEIGRQGDKENDLPSTFDEEMRGLGDEEEGRRGDEENEMVRHAERSRSKTDEPESQDEENRDIEPVGAENFLPAPQAEPKSEPPAATPRFAVNFSEIEKTSEESVPAVHEELQEIPFLLTIDHGPLTIADVGAENFLPSPKIDEAPEPITYHPEPVTRHPEQANVISDLEETPRRVEGSDRIDFIHWLEKLQPVKTIDHRPWTMDEVEEDEMVRHTERSRSATDLTETKDLQPAAHSLQPELQPEPDPNALIDKFIETNPSVSRVKERFYDPAVQARESERLDDNLMTETLARIFVKQEKYERAIDAYRKLQLKYPEKSDYFAALILDINSKIN